MSQDRFWVNPADEASIEALIDAVSAQDTPYEPAIWAAIELHRRPFSVFIDYVFSDPDMPTFDRFSFDMGSDELIVFCPEPAVLIDALLEMAMFMRGFNTLIGVDEKWKTQVAIGAWRTIRESLKQQLGIPYLVGHAWLVELNPTGVANFDEDSFFIAVALAGSPDVEAQFPAGTSPKVISVYKHLSRIIALIGQSLGLQRKSSRLNR